MLRLIGIIIVVALIGWLALHELDATRGNVRAATAEAARISGTPAVKIAADATPGETAEAVGRQAEQAIAAGKARTDAAEAEQTR
jgi:uncharacterized protein (TIGR02588 family)